MTIPAFPEPRPARLFSSRGDLGAWLAGCRGFYPSGTESFYWALRGVGVGPGTRVWMPSFNCGIEVAAAEALGAEVGFFRMQRDLTIHMEDLEQRVRAKPGPVVLIHYFGFPQPEVARLDALCRELQIPWIADCAHALLTRRGGTWLHEEAPVAVFSLHKFVGLYDGGALHVDEGRLREYGVARFNPPDPGRFFYWPYLRALKLTGRRLLGERVTAWYRRVRFAEANGRAAVAAKEDDTEATHPYYRPTWFNFGRSMSVLSRGLLRRESVGTMIGRRRANYERLAEELRTCTTFSLPQGPRLVDGVCPLVLPVECEQRDTLWYHLKCHDIDPFVFGEHAWPTIRVEEYPNMRHLRDHYIGIPVHQDLSEEDLARIARVLRAWRPA